MDKDPAFIAQQVKFLRRIHNLTQENLAEAANLSTRTIEKVESGRHVPDEQTLRGIARALGFDAKIFNKPSPEQEAQWQVELDRAGRKTALVPTYPIREARNFLQVFAQRHALRLIIRKSQTTRHLSWQLHSAIRLST